MVAYIALVSALGALAASVNAVPTGDDNNLLIARGLQTDVAIQFGRDAWLVAQSNILPDNCADIAEKDFKDKAQKIGNPDEIAAGTAGFDFWSEGDSYWYRAEPNGSGGQTMDVMYNGRRYVRTVREAHSRRVQLQPAPRMEAQEGLVLHFQLLSSKRYSRRQGIPFPPQKLKF